jgi:hypothetical protein
MDIQCHRQRFRTSPHDGPIYSFCEAAFDCGSANVVMPQLFPFTHKWHRSNPWLRPGTEARVRPRLRFTRCARLLQQCRPEESRDHRTETTDPPPDSHLPPKDIRVANDDFWIVLGLIMLPLLDGVLLYSPNIVYPAPSLAAVQMLRVICYLFPVLPLLMIIALLALRQIRWAGLILLGAIGALLTWANYLVLRMIELVMT